MTWRRRTKTIARLRELIAALDRRVPQLGRVGEPRIASDSAALKRTAQAQIAELERDAHRVAAGSCRAMKRVSS